MRRFFAVTIVLCLLYFAGGYLTVLLGLVARDDYFAYAGIVGGLASVAGLLALTRPAITQTDVQAIEVSALKSMARTAGELEELNATRSKTEEEIDSLTARRKEMELLVRKASLAIFLKEQVAHYERQILEEVSRSNILKINLEKASDALQKLAALNEEIDRDPNVSYLQDIIATASARQPTISELASVLPPYARVVLLTTQSLGRIVSALVK